MLFNKPFNVLCQFSRDGDASVLADYLQNLPGFYPAGRLDKDSEGLLVLTNDGALQHRIAHPTAKMSKTYLAQVEGEISDAALQALRDGVRLKDGPTRPAQAARISTPEDLWPRVPPIRERRAIPTSWLELTISEGRNRQVRRMTAAVGFPTLRLIRRRVGPWQLDGLQPGQFRRLPISNNVK
ncbi:pseudouridine synthase [Granulosicoccaceae sp. 1_MG-2023]|nr:pseudouridine synthase [Granulosicoccaceae sp. 1_MG-2023]